MSCLLAGELDSEDVDAAKCALLDLHASRQAINIRAIQCVTASSGSRGTTQNVCKHSKDDQYSVIFTAVQDQLCNIVSNDGGV